MLTGYIQFTWQHVLHHASFCRTFKHTHLCQLYKTKNMNDALYITNRTGKPMLATISDNYTGNDIVKCELQPGSNRIETDSLDTGTYYISLVNHNNDIIYKEKIVKN